MPDDNPGKLSRRQYADIVAYLLQLNGMPRTGPRSLSADPPQATRTDPHRDLVESLNARLVGAVAEPPISPRTPPACVSGFINPGGSLRFAHRGLISFTPPACKTSRPKGLRGH